MIHFRGSMIDHIFSNEFSLLVVYLLADENDIALVPLSSSHARVNNLHRSHQHIFQHQSSVSSNISVQTVFHQNVHQTTTDNHSVNSLSGAMVLIGNSSSSTSFQSANGSNINGSVGGVSSTRCVTANQMDASGSVSSLGSNGNAITSSDEALTVADVADLLHPQYAIISGGKSREGCPIITFPDHNNFHLLTDYDYQKLILYLTSVPT